MGHTVVHRLPFETFPTPLSISETRGFDPREIARMVAQQKAAAHAKGNSGGERFFIPPVL